MRELIRSWWRIGSIYVDKSTTPHFLAGQPHKLHNRVCAICLASRQGQEHCRESMNQAQQEMDKIVNQALENYNKIIPTAKGQALKTINEAEGYKQERINQATGDVARFKNILVEYEKAPEITRRRLYLETMEKILPRIRRKVIIDEDARSVLPLLDLKSEGRSK